MKKILILLITTVLLTSCFGKDVEEAAEDIVSNVVDVQETLSWSDSEDKGDASDEVETSNEIDTDESDIDEEESTEESAQTDTAAPSEPIVSGSDNDPRVDNTQGEWTNPPETLTPSVPTEPVSNGEEEIIKDFEAELDSLFDLLESDEG